LTDRLSILHVNADDVGGGAARVADNLVRAQRGRGHDAWLAVGARRGDTPYVRRIGGADPRNPWARVWSKVADVLLDGAVDFPGSWRLGRLARFLADPAGRLAIRRGCDHVGRKGTRALPALPPVPPAILHCHNLHGGYFDLAALPRLSRRIPTIVTLHDAWLLSGHCAHPLDCDRWRSGCGECPDLTLPPAIPVDATAANWRRKQDIYRRCRLHVAAPCRWMLEKAADSILAEAMVESRVIPNGVDTSIYRPGDRLAARAGLGLERDRIVLLFAASGIRENPWKDFATMREAVRLLGRQGREVLLIGVGQDGAAERLGSAEIRFVGYRDDPQWTARHYQAADVYIHAAKAETFPNVVLEALACGAPVVATAVGGIGEQVRCVRECGPSDATGVLVPVGGAAAMAEAVGWLMDQPEARLMLAANAAADAATRFSLDRQVAAYLEWYVELAGRGARRSADASSV